MISLLKGVPWNLFTKNLQRPVYKSLKKCVNQSSGVVEAIYLISRHFGSTRLVQSP